MNHHEVVEQVPRRHPPFLQELSAEDQKQVIRILYTNYRGEKRWRRVIPLDRSNFYRKTAHHPQAQHFLHCWDVEKRDYRSFALLDIHQFAPDVTNAEDVYEVMAD